MKESVKPPVDAQLAFTACSIGLLAISGMPGVGEPARDVLLLASIFFGGAGFGASVYYMLARRVLPGKEAA